MQIIVSLLQQSKSGSVFIFFILSAELKWTHTQTNHVLADLRRLEKEETLKISGWGGGGSYSRDGHLNK